MSKKNHNKHRLPPVKPAPPIAAEPPDIDNEAKLSPSEKAMLNDSLASYAKASGGGVTQLPAEFKPVTLPPNVAAAVKQVIDNTKEAFKPPFGIPNASPKQIEAVKAAMSLPANTFELSKTTQTKINAEIEVGEAAGKLGAFFGDMMGTAAGEFVIPDQDERLALASAFNQIANNVSVGAELFANLSQAEVSAVHLSYSQAVHNLLLTGSIPRSQTLEPLDLRGLVALSLRGQEDKHNRRALLDLCARLDITAEELTLAQVRDSLGLEAWRLGEAAEEIPDLEINPDNEALWKAYKVELGLIKRPGK